MFSEIAFPPLSPLQSSPRFRQASRSPHSPRSPTKRSRPTTDALSRSFTVSTAWSPSLPSELWTKIFSLSTAVNGALTVTDYSAIAAFSRDSWGISVMNRFRESMDLRLSLCLVCRSWRMVASPLIYEHILIQNTSSLTMFLEHLRLVDVKNTTWWTRRIDVALSGVNSLPEECSPKLAQVISHCPNLEVFSSAFCADGSARDYSAAIMTALSTPRLPASLRRLEIKGNLAPLARDILPGLADQLEILWMLPSSLFDERQQSVVGFEFPKLRTLISAYGYTAKSLRQWHTPQLQQFLADDFSDFGHRVGVCGAQLTQLAVPNIYTLPPVSTCPNLRELIVRHELLVLPHRYQPPSHSAIKCITMENVDYVGRRELTNRPLIHASLPELRPERFPALECVRIHLPICCQNQPVLEFSEMEIEWMKLCLSKGIQLLTSSGSDEWTADEWTPLKAERLVAYGSYTNL